MPAADPPPPLKSAPPCERPVFPIQPVIRAALVEVIHAGGGRRFQFAPETPASDFVALAILDEFFYREAELPEADPDRVMADVKSGLPLLERGVGMFFNMGVALDRVELAPGTATGFLIGG